MNFSHLFAFSPTESSMKIGRYLLEVMGYHIDLHDLTHEQREREYDLNSEEIAFFAYPVYGGRVPAPFLDRLKKIKGKATRAVVVAVYGNRAYEDAILEMADFLEERGFIVVAALTAIAEHCYTYQVATGRPNPTDYLRLRDYAPELRERVKCGERVSFLPGNRPYKEGIPPATWAPKTYDNCISCGICVVSCPMGIISTENPKIITDTASCIHCLACVKNCPEASKYVQETEFDRRVRSLEDMLSKVRNEPELFL